jgi:hypothetical protein
MGCMGSPQGLRAAPACVFFAADGTPLDSMPDAHGNGYWVKVTEPGRFSTITIYALSGDWDEQARKAVIEELRK